MKLPWKRKNKVDEKDLTDWNEEDGQPKEKELEKVSIRQLFRYATRLDLFLILVGLVFSIVTGVGGPLTSIVMGSVTQSFINATYTMQYGTEAEKEQAKTDFENTVITNCVQYAIIGGIMCISASIQVTCLLTVCERMTDKLRRAFVKGVLRQDIAWFDKSQSGSLAAKLFDNLERVREGTGDKVALLVQYTALFFGGFIIAFCYDWRLTLIMMSLSPLMVLCGAFIAKWMAMTTALEAKKYAVAGGIAEEAIASIRTVQAFNAQSHEAARYEQALEAGKKDGIKKAYYVGIGFACTILMVFSSYFLAFWVGTDYVSWGWLKPGTVMTVFFSVMQGSMALGQAGPQIAVLGGAQGAAAALHDIIDRTPDIDCYSTDGIVPKETKGRVSFKGVRFSYPNRANVEILKGISLECSPGETIAFVGSSGCGKSTSISLLLRYYDPTHGQIILDGVDIRDLNISFLRNTIGVVSQEPVLFDTTIEENIRFGREDVTKDEMYDALRKANAYDFVTVLPQGLKTLVGARGTQLSGGQKQRIAIARALVRNPKILLLDEATSALDAQSERVVQVALENASRGRTTFIVAHRLSTIRNADCIVVFKDGVIVERGRHHELLSAKGHYYALVHAQVFTDMNQDKPEEVVQRRMSKASSVREERALSIKEHKEKQAKKKDDLKRLKKELEEEGVSTVGLFGILRSARPEWPLLIVAFIASAIRGCVFPIFSIFFTDVLEVFSLEDKDEMRSQGHMYSLIFLALGIIQGITIFTSSVLFGYTSEFLTMRLRLNAFKKLLGMHISFMDDPRHAPGKLCTRLATDAPMVKSALDNRLGSVASNCVSIASGVGIAFFFGWQMALLMIFIFPLPILGQFIQVKYTKERHKKDNISLETAGKIATEAVENIRTVQALTLERNVHNRFCSHCDGPLKTATVKALMQGLSYGFSSSITYFVYAAAFRFGLWLIMQNDMTPMHVLKVLFALSLTTQGAGMASSYFPEYIKATFAAGLIFRMLGLESEIDGDSETVGVKGELQGNIQLRNLRFAYNERKEVKVLGGVNLDVKQGQTVALVGPSGCGKSTIVSLLERFYDPTGGSVMIDGTSLTHRNLRDVRSQMAIVSQEPILFDMTIRENISYGLHEVTEDEIIAAAKMANAHNFITSMPAGYETRVGEKGTQLSGGQKQRVAIARALVRNPKILLLDEATSALDMESEKIVQDALDVASEGRTCIVIAHRLATVVNADKIVVVNQGEIVEQGTHDELMASRGAYFKLSAQQAKKSSEEKM